MPQVLHIIASQPQHTPAGNLLGRMYYRGFLTTLLSREQYSGYPHNGGEHSLTLSLSKEDLTAFVDTVREKYAGDEGLPAFLATIETNLKKRYPSLTVH